MKHSPGEKISKPQSNIKILEEPLEKIEKGIEKLIEFGAIMDYFPLHDCLLDDRNSVFNNDKESEMQAPSTEQKKQGISKSQKTTSTEGKLKFIVSIKDSVPCS